ncbi:hypothetical protein PG993_013354 [Apiospora rasikravindrae]|uniref:Uncharacterized protein n=1 Tax=Apiospora rasikravindrae TaxID=990691 RepID=A0ABR1RXE3_9PEZI
MEPALTAKQRRSRRKQGPALLFVDETEPFRIGRQNESTRLVIRHQAARSGCRNRRRPRGADSGNGPQGAPQEEEVAASARVQDPGSLVLPSYNGYETMRARLNFDITCLTSFTNTDLTARACTLLQENPRLAGSLLQQWPSCFLAYLPSRYGSRPFLDDTMRCVAARAAHMVGSSHSPILHTVLYSKALASLGAAVKAEDPSLISDIYCATRLLVLYESLGSPNQNALTFHNDAGVDIVKQIDPARSLNAFDQALIRSHGPYVVTKAIFTRESALFESRQWQDFFHRAASEEPDADSQLTWRFIGAISFIAGILRDVQGLFESPPMGRSEYVARTTDILERTGQIRRAFEAAHLLYQQRPPYPPPLFALAVAAESPGRVQARSIFFHSMIFLCRIRETFAPTAQERAASEDEAQALAAQALLAASTAQSCAPGLAWHWEEQSDLVRSIMRTKEDWTPVREPEQEMTWEELTEFLLRRLQKWFTLWTESYLVPELRWSASSDIAKEVQ